MRRASVLTDVGVVAAGLLTVVALLGLFVERSHAAREQTTALTEHTEGWLQWRDLDATEWQRVQQHRAAGGSHLAQLTPYEVLGIYTDDPARRQHYAAQNARFMLDMHARMTAFEDLYRAELARQTKE